jgi:hypothetical protein
METSFLTSPLVWRQRLLEGGIAGTRSLDEGPSVGELILQLREKLRADICLDAPKPHQRKMRRTPVRQVGTSG